MPGTGYAEYNNTAKPYQATALISLNNPIPQREQTITYTSFQRPNTIEEGDFSARFEYNAAGNRTSFIIEGSSFNSYMHHSMLNNEYEYWDENTRQFLYVGGDAYSAPAVLVIPYMDNPWELYYLCRDYLGSITHIVKEDGTAEQELSYDAWGRLRNPDSMELYAPDNQPSLFLGRGYTGHEHIPQFGLINMNARLYDPWLGRFLSPDPYVQAPDFTQSFNRYSYCWNNPLRYVDENGEWIHIVIGAAIGGTINLLANLGNVKNFWQGLGYFGVGALAGALGAGVGAGISSVLPITSQMSDGFAAGF